jgi:DNA-binding NtrC family response regulator
MNGKILIVDDEVNIRESLSSHFRFLGYDVALASDGQSAIDHLSENRTDIVISDIVMPGMNGVDLLKHIRGHHPMIKVIMITGYVTQENALTCMRQNAYALIFKPFEDITELEQAVNKAFQILESWETVLYKLHDMKVKNEPKR